MRKVPAMSYEFPVDTAALLGERHPQWVNLGLPAADLDRARASTTTMWADRPGGWTYELSALARGYAGRGEHYLASLAYGIAKVPALASKAKREAQRRQLEEYLKAAPAFGVRFERRVLHLPYRGGTTAVPVHLLSRAGNYGQDPVLLFSGGIDTWKMDLHPLAAGLAAGAGVTVQAFDIPGTGEAEVPLDRWADGVVHGLIGEARRLGNGMAGYFGLSFGGNFAAMAGLSGAVDAAVDLGGPVDSAFAPENFRSLMFGMAGIAGNAYGFTVPPTEAQIIEASAPFLRRALLSRPATAPMLVINGADDVHVPQADTLVFRGRPDTEVHLIPGTGHCAASKLPQVMPIVTGWLAARLAGSARPAAAPSARAADWSSHDQYPRRQDGHPPAPALAAGREHEPPGVAPPPRDPP
jgi:esterase FrsA